MKLTIFLSSKNEKEFHSIYDHIKEHLSATIQTILVSPEDSYMNFNKEILSSDVVLMVVPTLIKEQDIQFLKSANTKVVVWGFSELISKEMKFANFISLSLPEIISYLMKYKVAIENPLENIKEPIKEKAIHMLKKEIINIYYCEQTGRYMAVLDNGEEIEIKLE